MIDKNEGNLGVNKLTLATDEVIIWYRFETGIWTWINFDLVVQFW